MPIGFGAFTHASVEFAEAEVAVGDEGAHAEFGGERERLAIVGLGRLNPLGRIERRGNGAETAKDDRFRAPLLLSPSEIKGPLRTFPGLCEPPGQQGSLR